jgi:hypothetical protein
VTSEPALQSSDRSAEAWLVRLGGAAALVAVAIHVVVNSVIKEFPSRSLGEPELRAYFTEQFGAWAVVHGARYVAALPLVLFLVGVFVRTGRREAAARGWGVVGLIGPPCGRRT